MLSKAMIFVIIARHTKCYVTSTKWRQSLKKRPLPSLFMPASTHFLSLQARHWFLWVLSTGQVPCRDLQMYCLFLRIDLCGNKFKIVCLKCVFKIERIKYNIFLKDAITLDQIQIQYFLLKIKSCLKVFLQLVLI